MIAKLLRDPRGTATLAECLDSRGYGPPDFPGTGMVTALQRRHEQGIGPDGAHTEVVHRWPHREPPRLLAPPAPSSGPGTLDLYLAEHPGQLVIPDQPKERQETRSHGPHPRSLTARPLGRRLGGRPGSGSLRAAIYAPWRGLAAALLNCLDDDQLAQRRLRGRIKDAMPTDLTVILEHRPGELARLGEITGEVGVSIRGLAAFTGEGRGVVHLLLDDQAAVRCREALERAGMGVADQREVLVVDIVDRPGALGELTRQLSDANVNIELAYTTFGGVRLVIATDDLTSARAALG
jgi:hypothetical protein